MNFFFFFFEFIRIFYFRIFTFFYFTLLFKVLLCSNWTNNIYYYFFFKIKTIHVINKRINKSKLNSAIIEAVKKKNCLKSCKCAV